MSSEEPLVNEMSYTLPNVVPTRRNHRVAEAERAPPEIACEVEFYLVEADIVRNGEKEVRTLVECRLETGEERCIREVNRRRRTLNIIEFGGFVCEN